MDGSKRRRVSGSSPSSSKSKLLIRQSIWKVKENLVRERLRMLERDKNNGKSMTVDGLAKCDPPEVKTAKVVPPTCDGVEASAVDRAKEVQANLSPLYPTFFKEMFKSHVGSGFLLRLPHTFCKAHLPKHDVVIVLVDEHGGKYDVNYLASENALSGGWRGFAITHKLQEGDVLVFQLIKRSTLRLYIVRARKPMEVDTATTCFQDLASTDTVVVKMEEQSEDNAQISETGARKYPEILAEDPHHGEESMDGLQFSDSETGFGFNDKNGFKDFSIHVNGLILNSELPTCIRTKYYSLCCGQNMLLHDNLVGNLNQKLVAGMISEMVRISDAIRSIKSTTATDLLESWDGTLKVLEDLGMAVGFIRSRINLLLQLSSESQAMIRSKKIERAALEDERRTLSMELLKVEKGLSGIDAEINNLEVKHEEVAAAPWGSWCILWDSMNYFV